MKNRFETLEAALQYVDSSKFFVRLVWGKLPTKWRWTTVSTLTPLRGYENIYGDLTNYGLAAAFQNALKIVKGKHREKVKEHPWTLTAVIRCDVPSWIIARKTDFRAMTKKESEEAPILLESNRDEWEIPKFIVSVWDWRKTECQRLMKQTLNQYNIDRIVSVEDDCSSIFLYSSPSSNVQ